jgi:hypothetical protein
MIGPILKQNQTLSHITQVKGDKQVISNRFWSKQQDGKKQELRPPFKGSWSTCNHEIYA